MADSELVELVTGMVLNMVRKNKQAGTSKTCLHSSHYCNYADICQHSCHQAYCTIAIEDLCSMAAYDFGLTGMNLMGIDPSLIF